MGFRRPSGERERRGLRLGDAIYPVLLGWFLRGWWQSERDYRRARAELRAAGSTLKATVAADRRQREAIDER